MSINDVNQRIEHGLQAENLLKASEQKEFLGVYRERIYFCMTTQQMKRHLLTFKKLIIQKKGGHIRIAADLDSTLKMSYLKFINEQNIPFTLVDFEKNYSEDSIVLVYFFDTALNENDIDISNKNI